MNVKLKRILMSMRHGRSAEISAIVVARGEIGGVASFLKESVGMKTTTAGDEENAFLKFCQIFKISKFKLKNFKPRSNETVCKHFHKFRQNLVENSEFQLDKLDDN